VVECLPDICEALSLIPSTIGKRNSSENLIRILLNLYVYLFFFLVLEFKLKAVTLNHSTSSIFVKGFSR
jgi:hypothetical protein